MNGYVDLQVNGFGGVDFNQDNLEASDFFAACHSMRHTGVARFLPTIITAPIETMVHRIERLADLSAADPEIDAMVAGIHVEGPFLNRGSGFIGAHPVDAARIASIEDAERLIEAGAGRVKLLTLAPECDPESKVTAWLADQGIAVAAGHTDASLDQLRQGIDAGMTLFTHLGNGCPGLMHRHDNIVQRALACADDLTISFIADGHHVPLFALSNYLRCIDPDRVIIVTDAISAAGLGPGRYELAGQIVEVDDDLAAWATGRQHYAGCATSMDRMVDLMASQLRIDAATLDRWTRINPSRVLESNRDHR